MISVAAVETEVCVVVVEVEVCVVAVEVERSVVVVQIESVSENVEAVGEAGSGTSVASGMLSLLKSPSGVSGRLSAPSEMNEVGRGNSSRLAVELSSSSISDHISKSDKETGSEIRGLALTKG